MADYILNLGKPNSLVQGQVGLVESGNTKQVVSMVVFWRHLDKLVLCYGYFSCNKYRWGYKDLVMAMFCFQRYHFQISNIFTGVQGS